MSAVSLIRVSIYMMSDFNLATFKTFCLSFNVLTLMCLGVDLFGVHRAPWMCRLVIFVKCQNFSAITSSNIFLTSLPPSSLSVPALCICGCTGGFHILWGSVHFSSFAFLSDCLFSICLQICRLCLLPSQICYWAPLVNFPFWLLYFSTEEFPLGSLCDFYLCCYYPFHETLSSSFNSSNSASFNSLNMVLKVAFMSLLSPTFDTLKGSFYCMYFFFPVYVSHFLIICMCLYFCWKLDILGNGL